MTRFSYRWLRTALVLIVCALSSSTHAATIALTWDEDMVIYAANSFPEPPAPDALLVNIVDGINGPTTVQLRDGGVIGGVVRVRQNSHLHMTGGGIEALVTLFGNFIFTLSGGTVLPLVRGYDNSDVSGVIRVTEQGTLNLRGGMFFGDIDQQDESVINIYGHSFVTQGEFPNASQNPSGVRVQGMYANGSPFDITILRRGFDAQVFLHTIPEPTTFSLLGYSGVVALGRLQIA
ncbi:MAG: hypothetical protein SH868_13445 [Bythopirellula sp.]|nr:hypothetical protein [Bythopirellula sp.]